MSRYQELVFRIEKYRGWTKEVDDLLLEIYQNFNGGWFNIRISPCERGHIRIILNAKTVKIIGAKDVISTLWNKDIVEFPYDGQCDKNRKFKDALMWLLDHSLIKKNDSLVGKKFYDMISNRIFEVRAETKDTITCGANCEYYNDAGNVISAYDHIYPKMRLEHCKEITNVHTMPELHSDGIANYRVYELVGKEVKADIDGRIYKVRVISVDTGCTGN